MAAIAAVDMALWDIKGKVAGLPLYQLLGGACREGVMVYGHANGETIEETIDDALALPGAGLQGDPRCSRACRASPRPTASPRTSYFYEPADADLPTENVWSTEKYLRVVPELFEAAREALGWDVHLLHDVHHRLTPIEAGRLGKDLEPYRPFWLEDATPAENQASFRLIRQHTTTPLAVGEVFNSIWDCKQLIEEQLIDYIRATVVHAGGITHLRRIAAFADLLQRAHRLPRRHRPVAGVHGRGAALRPVGPELRHPGIHAPHRRDRRGLPARLQLRGRRCCTRASARASASTSTRRWPPNIPYKRAYLPVNRLEDGTMTNW